MANGECWGLRRLRRGEAVSEALTPLPDLGDDLDFASSLLSRVYLLRPPETHDLLACVDCP